MPDRQAARDLPSQVRAHRRHRLPVRQAVQRLQHQHGRSDIDRNRRSTPAGGEQVREHRLGKQHPAVLGQQPEDTAPIDQMPRYRLGIQQFTLIKRKTLHTQIVPAPNIRGQDDTRYSADS
jgi:hypothetical protein